MKKMYSFLIIVAAMTSPSCNDSKKSDTAETEKKPETACDCIKKSIQVLKDFKKLSVEDISKIPDIDAYMDKKMNEGNDCEKIMKENDKKYPTPESLAKDCPAMKELMALMKEFGQGEASQPEEEMQNEDADFEGESGDMEMPDMSEPEIPEDY